MKLIMKITFLNDATSHFLPASKSLIMSGEYLVKFQARVFNNVNFPQLFVLTDMEGSLE